MIWEFHGYGGQLAVIDDNWKAVRQRVRSKKPGGWQLYDLNRDPAEVQNLATKHPEIVKRLEEAFRKDRTKSEKYKLPIYD